MVDQYDQVTANLEFGLQEFGRSFGGDVALMEGAMLEQPQVSCPVIHRFGPGVYIREVFMPAGTLAVGHHQNFEHMNIMLKGRVTILNSDGTASEMVAPMMFVGQPGRKIGFVHEDMVWLNVYPTTETDVEVLEATYLTKSESFGRHIEGSIKLLQNSVDQQDFQVMLDEVGFTAEQVREQSENVADMVDLPHGSYKIKVGASMIEGKGLFATAGIEPGERIAPARLRGLRTIAGRYTNHSASPNAVMVRSGHDIDLVATQPIGGCRGGLDGDEITIDYRQAVALTQSIGLEKFGNINSEKEG
jgi:hypothetical protein